tara:strand:+ start:729 stop:1334 length:606 start_codon:yes stop_codon:yes gene_type:complete
VKLRIDNIVEKTRIYGPGWRTAIWVKGCTLACEGCWNQDLWPHEGGTLWNQDDLLTHLLSIKTEGVTFLGGEPLQQPKALLPVLQGLKQEGRSIFIYSGYDEEEMNSSQKACLELADIAVLGRYVQELRNTNLKWRGSENQTVEFRSNRYDESDMGGEANQFEVHISKDGHVKIIGYPDDETIEKLIGMDENMNPQPVETD